MNQRCRPPASQLAVARAFTAGVLAVLAAMTAACPGSLPDPARFTPGDDASSSDTPVADAAPTGCGEVTQTLFAPACGAAGCHGASAPAAGLDLVSPGVAGRLVGQTASGGGVLVDPAHPSASVLYTKLLASPPYGSRMPLGAPPLSDADTACVLAWIESLGPLDAGAGTPSPAGSPEAAAPSGWTPSSLAGTVLWLDAGQGVTVSGGFVTKWKDQTTFGNDASQPDSSTAPTLDASGVRGRPAIHFDETRGTFLSIADAASLQWGTGGFLVAIVGTDAKATAGRGHGGGLSTVFAKPQQQSAVEITVHFNFFTAENQDDDSTFHVGEGEGEPGLVSTTHGYNDGQPRLYVARVDTSTGSTAMELRVNGVRVGSSSGDPLVNVTLAGSPVRIGSTYGQSAQGDIAEVVAVRGTVQSADLAQLEGYLVSKYRLASDGGT